MATQKVLVKDVMQASKCTEAQAKAALKATKGQHWTQAALLAIKMVKETGK